MKLLSNNSIEYCVDIQTDFKLINNKHILKTFLKALEIHKYKSAKIDFKIQKGKWVDKADLKGDLIRLEFRALEQNKIENISDVEKAKEEIREFLGTMSGQIIRSNQYSKPTIILIEKLIQEI